MTAGAKRTNDNLEIRQADDDELDAVIACCAEALGWNPDEPNADFFRWKHRANPFGPSPIWVAVDDGRIVGVRVMMRWQFQRGNETLQMVRAVDTATLPSHQGKGIFTRLTTAAVEELTGEGVDAVFNTPNDKSRPGYLKMGWVDLDRVPVSIRLRSPLVLPRLAKSRTAAGKWGESITIGTTDPDFGDLAAQWQAPAGWHTPMSADYLAWRYGFEPLGYRFADGAAIRVRTRGAIRELSVCDVFGNTPPIGKLLRTSGSDVAISTGLNWRHGFVPARPLGPRFTWRNLANQSTPTAAELELSLGTVELF